MTVILKNSEALRKEHGDGVAHRRYPSSLLLRCQHHWTCSSKKQPCQPCRLQDDRWRPSVEKCHLVLQASLDVASRTPLLNRIPIRQIPSALTAVIGQWMTILLKATVTIIPNMPKTPCAINCQSKHDPVSLNVDFAGLFGIVLQCNLTINSQARVRVAARSSP